MAGEGVSGSCLVFGGITWTAGAINPHQPHENLSLLPTASGQISTLSVNISFPSAVAQCFPGHVVTFFSSPDGLEAE